MRREHFFIALTFIAAVGFLCTAGGGRTPLVSAEIPKAGIRFVDITQSTGIGFRHNSAPEKKYIVESMSGGLALFDYDNDDDLDIYFTNSLTVETAADFQSSPSALYRNDGDGRFTDVTERSGLAHPGWAMGVVVADYDGDGYRDLYVTCLGPNHLYRNRGDGTFLDVTERAGVNDDRWSTGAAFGDFDNDGDLDLFVANYVDFKLDDLPEFGKGEPCHYRGMPVQCGPRGLPGAGDTLFRNNGDGTFTDVTSAAGVADPEGRFGLGVVWADLDEDGWADLFVANDAGPNFLYKNNGDGTFTDEAFFSGVAVSEDGTEQGSMGVALGDYNHDGKLDLYVTNFSDQYNILYRQDGSLSFMDASFASRLAPTSVPFVGWGTEFVDFENDGWVDLLVVNGHVYPQVDSIDSKTSYAQRILYYRNNGDGTFSETAGELGEALVTRRAGRGAAFGDIDNDGDIDVVINNLDGAPLVLRNDGGNRNHWITIKTVGTNRNRDALGARVKVTSGDLVQVGEVHSSGSYISQSDLRLHFGLGSRSKVDLIEVRWPGGGVERIENLPADRFVIIEQNKGAVKQSSPR